MFKKREQLDTRAEYVAYAAKRGHKTEAILVALLHLLDADRGKTGLHFWTAEDVAGVIASIEKFDGLHLEQGERLDHVIKNVIKHYQAEQSIYFTHNSTYLEPTWQDTPADDTDRLRFSLAEVDVKERVSATVEFQQDPDVEYGVRLLKERKFRTLDNFAMMGRIYIFAALAILDAAVLVIIGVSAKLLSVTLLLPAIYCIYYLGREASFLNTRIQLLGNIYSSRNLVKLMLYNHDRSYMVVQKAEITGQCPICGGRLSLTKSNTVWNGRIVGRCDRNWLEHAFSFDYMRRAGNLLTK